MTKRHIGPLVRRRQLLSARTIVLGLFGIAVGVCGPEKSFGQEPFPPLSGKLVY